MKASQAEHPVRALCKTLRVLQVHAAKDATYGVPRIQAELADQGIKAGHNRIAAVMRANGLRGVSLRRGWCVTTQRDKERRPAPDLVQQLVVATQARLDALKHAMARRKRIGCGLISFSFTQAFAKPTAALRLSPVLRFNPSRRSGQRCQRCQRCEVEHVRR